MSSAAAAVDLTATTGYLVADSRGRVVGRVEAPMYGTSPTCPTRSPFAPASSAAAGSFRQRRSTRSTAAAA